jgi:hypothetical protein|tara:strand:+ start:389 stop:625 length:237 start_codon:yes stop_codon:yes gene_type:complete
MKRFFAFWIVSLVFAAIAGFLFGLIDYYTGATGQVLFKELGLYPLFAFFGMIVVYPVYRAIVGSFKIVFGRVQSEEIQ